MKVFSYFLKKWLMGVLLLCSFNCLRAQDSTAKSLPSLVELAQRAINKSEQLAIDSLVVRKAQLDKQKAWEAYLPKVTAEATYTRLNDDIVFPQNLQNLLLGTQRLLIKEGAAMQTAALPDAYKVSFSTPYIVNTTNPNAPSNTLMSAVQQNLQEIPPIQEKNILKANIQGQMLLFSGLKVPYLIKAANHQEKASRWMSESDKMKTINEVVNTYDKLAVLDQTAIAIRQTRALLNEQQHYIEKAFKNGLTIDLNRQKIQLAIEQLSVREYEIESNKKLLFIRLEELTGFLADSAALLYPELQIWQTDVLQGDAQNRPDIKAIDEAILATGYKQKSEWAEYIPKVVAVGKKELITSDLSMLDPEWYVGVAVRWTIFDGLAAKTSAQQAKIDKLILERKRDDAVQLAQLNLKKTEYDFQKYLLNVSSTKKQVEIAQSILSLSKKQFEQGLITPSEYMAAIVDLEKARLEYIQALAAQRAATASYLFASGNLTLDKIK